jgi:hypothetical protein
VCSYPEIRSYISAKAKKANGAHPPDEELGLWVDGAILSRHLKQPTQSLFGQQLPPSTERMLHFADLALGSIKPDKFTSEKVSKQRTKE